MVLVSARCGGKMWPIFSLILITLFEVEATQSLDCELYENRMMDFLHHVKSAPCSYTSSYTKDA